MPRGSVTSHELAVPGAPRAPRARRDLLLAGLDLVPGTRGRERLGLRDRRPTLGPGGGAGPDLRRQRRAPGAAVVAEPGGQPRSTTRVGGRCVRPVLPGEHRGRPAAVAVTDGNGDFAGSARRAVPGVVHPPGAVPLAPGQPIAGAGRRDMLDTLIVVGGVAPVFWVFLVAPLFGTGAPLAALLTYVAYPAMCLRPVLHDCPAGVRRASPDLAPPPPRRLDRVRADCRLRLPFRQPERHLCLRAALAGALDHLRDLRRMFRPAPARRGSPGAAHHQKRQWLATAVGAGRLPGDAHRHDLLQGGDHGSRPQRAVAAAASFFLVFLLCLRLSGLMVDNATQLRVQERMQRLADDLVHQSKHDPLTGLGNRLLFAETADLALARPAIDGDRAAAVLLLDLDDFKMVNDTFGHDAGDRVLVEVARRLEAVIRNGDESVFRLGGDEFAFLAPQVRLVDALRLADRITAALSEPFELGPRAGAPRRVHRDRHRTRRSGSRCVARRGRPGHVRRQGSGHQPVCVRPRPEPRAAGPHQLERELRDAADHHELRVLYQPIVHLASKDIVGVEALLRWDHPTRGTISPAEFIPLAETTGSILDLGDWVMEESLRQLRLWDESNPDLVLHLSVNVSPRQLNDGEFVGRVADMVQRKRPRSRQGDAGDHRGGVRDGCRDA